MQLHLGPIGNQNPRLLAEVGPDAGGDSVGLTTDPFQLGAFLGDLARENSLPNTILYNLNPTDNAVLSTMQSTSRPRYSSARHGGSTTPSAACAARLTS